MIRFLKRIFFDRRDRETSKAKVDISELILEIRQEESAGEIPPGRRIHRVEYGIFEIRLDRDITGNYRVTVYSGKEREYSFTVFGRKGEYEKLKEAFGKIFDFLDGEHKISNLPDNELIKGFYYGR